MKLERDQAVDAVVLMFCMSSRGVAESVFPKLSWPHRNYATRVSMSPQQVQCAELQSPIEQDLDVIQEQKPLAGTSIHELL